ncbi:MAG: HDIG domain-containing protein [Thermoclostridium sp.]|nr:HDIG domain-containing protein [Thermoclostridium sp.]
MNRQTAFEELTIRLESKELIQNSLAVEAIMRKLAVYLQEDIELWGMTGLLHNIDQEKVDGDLQRKGLVGAEILEGLNVNPTIIYAIKAHNPKLGVQRRRRVDKALFCAIPLADLLKACALSVPEKQLEELDPQYITDMFYDQSFKSEEVDREKISDCEEMGLSLGAFIELGLSALKEISGELKL